MDTVWIARANITCGTTPDDAVARAQAAIEHAATEGALVARFLECYVSGYRWPDKTLPPPDAAFLRDAWDAIATTAASAGLAVVLGTERIVDGAPRLSALVIDHDGAHLGFRDKVQLDPIEDSIYVPGHGWHVFQVGPLTFSVVICHEGWRYPRGPSYRWTRGAGAACVCESGRGGCITLLATLTGLEAPHPPYRSAAP